MGTIFRDEIENEDIFSFLSNTKVAFYCEVVDGDEVQDRMDPHVGYYLGSVI